MNRRERKAVRCLAITLRPVKKKGESKCKDQVPMARVLAIALDESVAFRWLDRVLLVAPGFQDAQAKLDDAIGDYEAAVNKRAKQDMAKIGTTHTAALAHRKWEPPPQPDCSECGRPYPHHVTGCMVHTARGAFGI